MHPVAYLIDARVHVGTADQLLHSYYIYYNQNYIHKWAARSGSGAELVGRLTLGLGLDVVAEVLVVVADDVSVRRILAGNEGANASGALLPGAADGRGVLPDHLGKVARVGREAGVVVVVLDALASPHVDDLVPAAEPASSKVLAVLIVGLSRSC